MAYLHHLFIDDFRKFKQRSFSFTDELAVAIDTENKRIQLNYNKEKANCCPYLKDKSKYVKVFVGPNGSGKSTLLNLIANSLPNGAVEFLFEGIVIYSDENRFFLGTTPKFDNYSIDSDVRNIEKIKIDHLDRERGASPYSTFFKETNFFYYSNTFDYSKDYADWAGLENLTTNYLVTKYASNSELDDLGGSDLQSKVKFKEYSTNAQFLSSEDHLDTILPFDIKRQIRLRILDDTFKLIFAKYRRKYESNVDSDEKFSPIKSLGLIWNKLDFLGKLRSGPALSLILAHYDKGFDSKDLNEFIFNNQDNEEIDYYLFDEILNLLKRKNPKARYIREKMDYIAQFHDNLDVLLHYSKEVESSLLIDLTSSSNSHHFKNFTRSYFNAISIYEYLDFDFGGLSSGEQSILSILSRLYCSIKKIDNHNNSIFLIDEGDIYFHPEWQRKFFNIVLNFLRVICKSDFQLIFTTHSPYLLTEVFKEHASYLSVDDPQKEITEDTYGANLFSIFEKGLFVEKPFGSEFCKELERVSKEIQNGLKETSFQEDREILSFIKKIGEKMISGELETLFYETIRIHPDKGMPYLSELKGTIQFND